ncbi:MAG: transposase [Nocardioidaceae bacterium]
MRVIVLTIDQRGSRTAADAIPALLTRLAALVPHPVLGFERTAGDEAQGVLDDPVAVIDVTATLLAEERWNIGIGVGPVQAPLPDSTRAGRGQAFVSAREAVTRAKSGAHHLSVVGDDRYRTQQVETVLWLISGILRRRTDRGREVQQVLAEGLSHADAGRRLGISQSAVSQRAQAAGLVDEERGRTLAAQLLAEALTGAIPSGATGEAAR